MATELLRTPVLEVRWCQLLGNARDNKFDPTKPPTWQIEGLAPSDNPEAVSFVEQIEGKFEEIHPGEKKHTHWLPINPDKKDPEGEAMAAWPDGRYGAAEGRLVAVAEISPH